MSTWLRITLITIVALFAIRLAIGLSQPFLPSAAALQPTPSRTPRPTSTPRPVLTNTNTAVPTRTATPGPTVVPAASILYQEDFEDGQAQNWVTYFSSWTIVEQGDNHYWAGTGPQDYPQAWINSSYIWDDYAFEAHIRVRSGGVFVCVRAANGGSSFYNVFLNSNDSNLQFAEYRNGNYQLFGSGNFNMNRNRWYTVRFEVQGNDLRFYIDNRLVLSAQRNGIARGGVGFYMGGGDEVHIDDMRVWRLDP